MPHSETSPASPAQSILQAAEPDTESQTETPSRLERMAHQIAAQHVIDPQPLTHPGHLSQLPQLAQQLQHAHQYLVNASAPTLALSTAAEWLLDNYHLVVQTFRQIEEDLPASYYRQLPKLAADDLRTGNLQAGQPHTGQPRIYAAAYAFWKLEEYLHDQARLRRFVIAYQQVQTFTMGELWALPTMLRLTLLETLAAVAERITRPTNDTKSLDSAPTEDDSPTGLNDNDLVAHCILSLRRLNSQDWNQFFEAVSLVQQILNQDPAGIYARMDFATRDRYREVVEMLARATGQPETVIAQQAIDMPRINDAETDSHPAEFKRELQDEAERGNGDGVEPASENCAAELSDFDLNISPSAHIGYYLCGQGREQLEKSIGYQPQGMERLRRGLLRRPALVYLGGIGLLTGLIIIGFVAYTGSVGGGLAWQAAAALLTLIPALTLAISLVNSVVSRLLPPHILPKLDFKDSIPASCRTMVVIPCLIATESDVASLTNELELHYLRNTDPYLFFGLLSDFADAQQAEMPEDAALVTLAQARIEELNSRYPGQRFYLFHRRRQWNTSQRSWMGWERKRGKLHEFNRLLRGDADTSFIVQIGNLTVLSQIRYVITLDADTILPRGEANRLVGTLAHPLNRPRFDAETGKLTGGYTVLQPRTAIKPTSANQSLFTQVFTGDRGIDLYTRAVSDVYQDLFGAGIFVGKGIYDVDAFERSLAGRVPENSILSHDLFEGIHGRVALVTDILLYEDYPPHYLVNVLRSYRWVRGDWQLLPWIWPRVPTQTGSIPNELSLIDRWKIIDNLRRSLLATALMALLTAGWTVLPGAPWVWTLLAVLTPVLGPLINTPIVIIHGIRHSAFGGAALRPVRDDVLRWLLYIAFLPYESLLMIDAILTTLRRLYTRKRLLQWTTAARTVRLFGDEATPTVTLVRMLPSTVATAVLAVLVASINIQALPIAAPFFLIWLAASQIAYWISRPAIQKPSSLTPDQVQQLRTLARRTWLFYEHFVGPDGNWLPPDHFQEAPRGIVAQRTSPTNIGLYLLTALAAHDLGYVGMQNLAVRLDVTFHTLEELPRYRGHFLNWIDTRSLATLSPAYVSTVDSGNLAGSLIAFKQGCLNMPQQPVWRWAAWQGLLDLLILLEEAVPVQAEEKEHSARSGLPTARLLEQLSRIRHEVMAVRSEPAQWQPLLARLVIEEQQTLSQLLINLTDVLTTSDGAIDSEVLQNCRTFMDRIRHHLDEMQNESDTLLPWLALLNAPPSLLVQPDLPPELAEAWINLQTALPPAPKLNEIDEICRAGQTRLEELSARIAATTSQGTETLATAQAWCARLAEQLQVAQTAVQTLIARYATLAETADRLITDMEFGFLFDIQRQLFHIGYNVDTGTLDPNYYDLLASEARIASLVAIAKYDVPHSHWIHLGRPLTRLDRGTESLLSWSGTMFEYLMPPLLLHSYPDTLLNASILASIEHQIHYARKKKVPWGISESGYYAFDAAMNYQYYAFGVPGLGFKRGLGEDLVISPYASLLALPFKTHAVLENMEALRAYQMLGRYGFYEAIDFTPAHLQLGQTHASVRSYMTHHQGMIMLAIVNRLQDQIMVQRFHADPRIQSVEMLLQEQLPTAVDLQFPAEQDADPVAPPRSTSVGGPWPVSLDTPMPMVHYLSNGHYGLLISNAGGGYSRLDDLALTRWRADTTLDNWGSWLYVQDLDRGVLWSATRQPLAGAPSHEEVIFYPHMVSFRRREQDIFLQMEVSVAPDDNVEVRRITLTNESGEHRRLCLTTYAEVALAPAAADRRHPAFAKLFVESEYVTDLNALLFRRRPRSAKEEPQFMLHMLVRSRDVVPEVWGNHSYESDRAAFLGRGRTVRAPVRFLEAAHLDDASDSSQAVGKIGATLDPIMALDQVIELPARATVQIAIVTLTAPTRQATLDLAQRYRSWSTVGRVITRAQTASEHELHHLELTTSKLEQIQQLLSLLIYPHAARRASAVTLNANRQGQSELWPLGISGDYPILLVRIDKETEAELLHDLLRAHTYWRRRGLKIDLAILNRQTTNYGQAVQDFIQRLIQRTDSTRWLNQRGGIFVLREDQMTDAARTLLHAVAHVVFDSANGSLAQQMSGLLSPEPSVPRFEPTLAADTLEETALPVTRPTDLQFDNGLGGFNANQEYVIYLEPGAMTPAPWINVIANPDFGCLVSETGAGYTWAINSGENRLTSWRNDPVSDVPAEALYLRDEETAEIWSPTPRPAPASAPYVVRHGAGYSDFEHNSHSLQQRVRIFVPPEAPIKVVQLRLKNSSSRPRRLTVTYYAEWVLGVDRANTQSHIVSEYAEENHTLLARNGYSAQFGQRVAFLAASKQPHGFTTNRAEFLGRLGTPARPAALERFGLSNRVDAATDPCAVLQLHINLAPGAHEDVYFLIGQGGDREAAQALVQQFQQPQAVKAAWQATKAMWAEILDTVTVETPDPALNLLLNRWLLYQTLACRMWGRSALYQSSGAYGFRDQLQDAMAVIHARPEVAREQILRAARHQFEAGDVLHWWHPPQGEGVRTRISDDLLWLPYVTAHYVTATGDTNILDQELPFLQGEPLADDEEERYNRYTPTDATFTLYEHCLRALHKGTTAGRHGIPLMGGGDWNDGMNRVGIEGKGESIWLGWFLHATLNEFAAVCVARGDEAQADRYREQAATIATALEDNGWDGEWYRRAYYDDGTPLGSAQSRECQIDSIAQSWSVLSGAGNPDRATQAMHAVMDRLVRWDEGLILLFTPPFDKTFRDPGYIKGYLPGVRENGGQYTHAALWSIWALTELGEGDRASALYHLLNPIYRTDTPAKAARYKVEPYVISADVYGVAPHVGRGGWTWYTGSSGWMYRLGIEAILGLRRRGHHLLLNPCIPKQWPGYTMTYRYGQTTYSIQISNPERVQQGVSKIVLDGADAPNGMIPLVDDGRCHQVNVVLGSD